MMPTAVQIFTWVVGAIWVALIVTVVFINPLRAKKRVTNGNVVFYIYWNPTTKDVYGVHWKRENVTQSETKWIETTKEQYEQLNLQDGK